MSAKVVTRKGKRVVLIKRTTRASVQKQLDRQTFKRPNLPEKPSVTKGPMSYGRSKKGGYIIGRFHITPYYSLIHGKRPIRWWVLDMDVGQIAEGTESRGYDDKKEAIRTAKEYRDTYGAWTVMPF